MKKIFAVIRSSIIRDYKNSSSYRLNFISEIIFNFIAVLLIYYISAIFSESSSIHLEKYGNNYFLFLLTGIMVLLFLTRVFSSTLSFVSTAQTNGYFDELVSSNTDFRIILLGSIFYPSFHATSRMIIIYGFSNIFYSDTISLMLFAELLVILILVSISFFGISCIFIGLNIVFKRTSILSSIFLLSCMIFSGILYPISVMPVALQIISNFFPSKYALEMIRERAFSDATYLELSSEILTITALTAVYLFIGLNFVIYSINKAKKHGTIAQF